MTSRRVSVSDEDRKGGAWESPRQEVVVPSKDPLVDDSFDGQLTGALRARNLQAARTLVAQAEFEGAPSVPRVEIATAKARIALTDGDDEGARAILVQAIERDPVASQTRTLLAEIMLATGRASDIRSVLTHLGQRPAALMPTEPPTDVAELTQNVGTD